MPRPPRHSRGRSPAEQEALRRQLDRVRREDQQTEAERRQREDQELRESQERDWRTLSDAERLLAERTNRYDPAARQARADSVREAHERQRERLAYQQELRERQERALQAHLEQIRQRSQQHRP